MPGELISIGRARLRAFGLSPQGISRSSQTRVPGKATFSGMDYQLTGRGEKVSNIEVITYPLVTGGLDMLGWLEAHHDAQAVISLWRLEANFLGRRMATVVIRNLEINEDAPHPFTGIGRKVSASVELVHVADPIAEIANKIWLDIRDNRRGDL